MNQNPQNTDHLNETMLYKSPGPHDIHGGQFDYVIVPEADIPLAQAQGWHLTTDLARNAHLVAVFGEPAQTEQVAAPAVSIPEAAPVAGLTEQPATQPQVELTAKEQTDPPTYDEMKAKATELGLTYPGNISKAALLAMITAKLAEQG